VEADRAAGAALAAALTRSAASPRLCLQGILFVLHTGIGWEDLPQELGFGSGMTCWRRLQRWTEAGVFDQIHQILLAKLNAANRIIFRGEVALLLAVTPSRVWKSSRIQRACAVLMAVVRALEQGR
jgi:transposase